MAYSAQQIVDMVQSGRGPESLFNGGHSTRDMSQRHQDIVDKMRALQRRMEPHWQGDAADAAYAGAGPLIAASEVSGEHLTKARNLYDGQGNSFNDLKNKIGDGPGPKPQSTFASDHLSLFSSRDEEIAAWNEKAQKVVDDYTFYHGQSEHNASNWPADYGKLGMPAGGADFKATLPDSGTGGDGSINAPVVGRNSVGPADFAGPGGQGSYAGGPGASVLHAAGSAPDAGATQPPAGSLRQPPAADGTGWNGAEWNDAARGGTTPSGYTDPSGYSDARQGGPGSGGSGPGGGLGPGGRVPGSGGLGPGGAAGGFGPGSGGAVAGFGPGAGGPGGFGPGGGSQGGAPGAGKVTGSAPPGKEMPSSTMRPGTPGGSSSSGARMPMGGMGGGGGRGRGGEDEEHQRPAYLEEPDPDTMFGPDPDQKTVPPVLGWRSEN